MEDIDIRFTVRDDTTAALRRLAEAARHAAEAIAEMAATFVAGPTRQQKKAWRRRVSRARWTHNDARFVQRPGRISVGSFDFSREDRAIRPPWER